MSTLENNGYSHKCLVKKINGVKIYLYKSWSLVHGFGYYCFSLGEGFKIGFGFHKTNKFSAVRQSLN